MEHVAIAFTLAHGPVKGLALVCVSARYCSVRWSTDPRLQRCWAAPSVWKLVEAELGADTLPAGPLPTDSAVRRLLVADGPVQYLWSRPLLIASPEATATTLDALLRDSAAAWADEG